MLVLMYCTGKHTIFLGDVNADIGTEKSNSIGGQQPSKQSLTGAMLHTMVQTCGITLPQTFAHYHIGPAHTWVNPGGGESRKDLAGASFSMRVLINRTIDENNYISGLTEKIVDAADQKDAKLLFKASWFCRPPSRKSKAMATKGIPGALLEDGTLADSPEQRVARWH